MPRTLVGSVERLGPGSRPGFTRVIVSGPGSADGRSFEVLLEPAVLGLPFRPGDRVLVDLDCRKGGWHRACDLVVRDARRRLLLAVAASGDPLLVPGWTVRRGEPPVSELLRESPRSVRHTHGVVLRVQGREIEAPPFVWKELALSEGSFWVVGHEVRWEGERPPGARDQRAWAALRRAR